ncbi:MAG: SGNH/GDSL hydrolase family protein [Bryobacter sp.]|nr:SGNH/GDSL hydrolase family protein [Bryobacter sp.]
MRIFLLLLVCLAAGGSLKAAPFSDLYFFGDSLSDAGNIGRLTAGAYPPSPYFSGRFSDGPVWSEQFALLKGFPLAGQQAGMTLGPNFLNLKVEGAGNNYAIGGARTDTTGSADSVGIPTGLFTQVVFYLSQSNFQADPNALYVLFGGSNDLRDAAQLSPELRDAAARQAAVNLFFNAFVLGQYGARRFAILNAPDIGLTPEARIVRNNAEAASAATLQYNFALDYMLNFLAFPNQQLFRFDTYSAFNNLYYDAINGGSVYGITNATTPCFPGFAGSAGADCATSLFADDLHPTAITHLYLAQAVDQEVHNPEPGTLGLVGFALVSVLWWQRRRRAN